MLLQTFFSILVFITIIFLILGVYKLVKMLPMLNTYEISGTLKDARITTDNVLGDDFDLPRSYLYYTYDIDGITHGGNSISLFNDAHSRNMLKKLVAQYSKSQDTSISVFVNKSDGRKSYLIDSKEIKNTPLRVALVSLASSLIIYLII